MSAPTVAGDVVRRLVAARLDLLRDFTGLPAVFGGAVEHGHTERIVISELRGTIGRTLDGLSVAHGRGLGGLALARARPCLVSDYRTNSTITHHFDSQVVDGERLTGVLAFPLRVGRRVVGVLYGASRDGLPIGDVAVRRTGGVVRKLEVELARLLVPQRVEPGRLSTPEALAELREIAARQTDPELRARLLRAHRSLAGPAADLPSDVKLAPREQQCLALVATGATNAEIAEELGLTVETVKTYLRNAMRRLEVGNRTAAAHVARTAGLI
ncbi:MAG: LuxR C-terminal-related transcriptional regulator [Pseudonocardia sp.]